jgi:predicted murein hydrolase (TIGR00659 family)
MSEFLQNATYFGVLLSLGSYFLGMLLKKKLKKGIFNPLLIATVVTILALLVLRVDYDSYYAGAKYLSYLLTPATICLAVPLYEQFALLRQNYKAILLGIFAGVVTSLCTIFLLSLLFRLGHTDYVTLLPKSITTAIGMGVSEELGGYVPLTVAVILITGVLGNVLAETVLKLFRITNPMAKGVAIGTASHAIGTTKAMELGDVEGAMSSLSILVAGLLTVAGASLMAGLI